MMNISPNDYIACICEGASEMTVMNLLLNSGSLCFDREDLLEEEVLSSKYFRDSKQFVDRYLTMDYGGGKVHVVLIQDRKNQKYNIKGPYLEKVRAVVYVVTAPEIEMLMIHSLGLYDDYKKHSSKQKPSIYLANALCKKTAKIKSAKNIEGFYAQYDLLAAIREHKRKSSKLGRDEIFLADLLRSDSSR